jgi:hypothetical protein
MWDWGGGGGGGGGGWEPSEEGTCTVLCELQGSCTVACERDLHVGAPLMSIRHLLHCNLCPWACPSFITFSLGGYSNSSSAKIVYTVSTSTTTQSSWILMCSRKMNLIIVAIVCVIFGCLLGMYAAKKYV